MNSQTPVNQVGRFTNAPFPLPLHVRVRERDGSCYLEGGAIGSAHTAFDVASTEEEAHFIVEAVNSYQAHLERIRVLEGALRRAIQFSDHDNNSQDESDLVEELRAALKGD